MEISKQIQEILYYKSGETDLEVINIHAVEQILKLIEENYVSKEKVNKDKRHYSEFIYETLNNRLRSLDPIPTWVLTRLEAMQHVFGKF